jgi:flagellar motor protein MotB
MNNVVGKTLIVMQLVFSLCFMCFAGAVFTFQSGWKVKATDFETRMNSTKKQLDDIQDVRQTELKAAAADVEKATEQRNVALAQVTELQTSLDQAVKNQASAEQERDKHLVDLGIAQQEAKARIAETADYRSENERLREQVNDGIAVRRGLEDELLEVKGLLDEAKERQQEQLVKLVQLKDVLRYHKVDPDELITGPVPPPIEKVSGVVTAAKKNDSRTAELVEVSVGSDDKIVKKMRLIIFRGTKYICEIEVTDVYPDIAVGRVIEETRNANIERGDNVTTKL